MVGGGRTEVSDQRIVCGRRNKTRSEVESIVELAQEVHVEGKKVRNVLLCKLE